MVIIKIPNRTNLADTPDTGSENYRSLFVRLSALAVVLLMSGMISVAILFLTAVAPVSAEISIPSGMDIRFYDPINNGSNWKNNPRGSWTFGSLPDGWGNGSITYIDSVQVTSKNIPQTITTNLTQSIDLLDYKKVILQFNTSAVSTKRGNQKESVIVTDENGLPHIVWIKSKASFSGTQSIDISNIVAENKSINITFQYIKKGGPVKNSLWCVDDVIVLGNKTGEVLLNTFEFNSSIYEVREDRGYVILNVTRTNSQSAASVDFYTEDVTALAGKNYGILNDINGVSGTINFAAGQLYNNTVQVPILHDPDYTPGLVFLIALENPSDSSYLGSPVEVDIIETDSVPGVPVVQFIEPSYDATENAGPVTLTLTSDRSSSVPFSVTYTASDSTALAGTNYGISEDTSVVTGTAEFPAGETSTTFDVNILDDGVYSHGTDFTIMLSSLPANAVIGTQAQATVNIIESDSEPAITAIAPATVDEGSQALITFHKIGKTMVPASFDISIGDTAGLATANLSTVTFGPSDTTMDLLLNVPGDGIYDPARTISLSFANEVDCVAPGQQIIAVIGKDYVPYTLNLKQGWNLVSFPVVNTTLMASDLVGTGVQTVSSYNIMTGDYNSYIIGISPSSYDISMKTDMGYFVFCTMDTSVVVYGAEPSDRSITIYPGWNMIGWSSFTSSTAKAVCTEPSLTGIQTIAKYNLATGDYNSYLEGISPDSYDFVIHDGIGYFVHTTSATPQTLHFEVI
jgi:hypothetical protein